jgi:SAM-dependent methyltransferase
MSDLTTTSDDYGAAYYDEYAGGAYASDSEHWRNFFGSIATEIALRFEPTSVLDAGCSKGLLVAAFRSCSVDAWGIDVSEHAITAASETVSEWLSVQTLTEPLPRRYDLVTCIEVLEHMAPADAIRAIRSITAATDRVVFSSAPDDFGEPTHVNTRTLGYWAAEFAKHGFLRRLDVDLSVIAPWAVVFERRQQERSGLVAEYENQWWLMRYEVHEKRQALLEVTREVAGLRFEVDAARGQTAELEHRQQVIDDLAKEAQFRLDIIEGRATVDQRAEPE